MENNYVEYMCNNLLNVELLPNQVEVLQNLLTHKYPMFLSANSDDRAYLLAIYSLLRCFFIDKTKLVVCCSYYQGAKIVFTHIDKIWKRADQLRDVCDSDGPRWLIDRCELNINNSKIMVCPISDGDKIRGIRPNVMIINDYNGFAYNVYESLYHIFAIPSLRPFDQLILSGSMNFPNMNSTLYLNNYMNIINHTNIPEGCNPNDYSIISL